MKNIKAFGLHLVTAVACAAILTGCSDSPEAASLKREQQAIVAEGDVIVADMEAANRNHDFSRVAEIRAHRADWERRGEAFRERAKKAGWK